MARDPVEEVVQDNVIVLLGGFALLFWCVPAVVTWWELFTGVTTATMPMIVMLVGHLVLSVGVIGLSLRPEHRGDGKQLSGGAPRSLLPTTGARHRGPTRGPKPHVPDVTFRDLRTKDFDGVEGYDTLANPLRVKETLSMHVRALCVDRLAELHPARVLRDATLPDMVRLRAIEELSRDEKGREELVAARGTLKGDVGAALARALGSEWAGQLELTEGYDGGGLEMLEKSGGLSMRDE